MSKSWATRKRKRQLQHILSDRDGRICHYCHKALILLDEIKTRCICQKFGDTTSYAVPDGFAIAQIDHKVPKARGGSNEIDNLVLACPMCNSRKGTIPYQEYVKGL